MICFRDMTFCGSNCTNKTCHRFFSDADLASARKWWGDDKPPIAFSDFSKTCHDYEEPKP